MASAIDATKPVSGAPTTSSERANWTTAKNEISAIQVVDATQTTNVTALQAVQVVAGGTITSDGSGGQDTTHTFGVSSVAISGSSFLVTLSSAVFSSTSMIITTGAGSGVTVRADTVNQTADTTFTYTVVSADSAVTTSGVVFSFMVVDAGA